jgi:tryptophan 2,3-dioxygenase
VESFLRSGEKRGSRRKPQTSVEVGLLVVDRLDKLFDMSRGMYDILRAMVSAPFSHVRAVALTSHRPAWNLWFRTSPWSGRRLEMVRRRVGRRMRSGGASTIDEPPG